MRIAASPKIIIAATVLPTIYYCKNVNGTNEILTSELINIQEVRPLCSHIKNMLNLAKNME
jgi:hypothetical protein